METGEIRKAPGVVVPLSATSVGETVEVTSLLAGGPGRRRLLDLGIVPGTSVEVLRRSPLGDPTAFLVRGAVIALRRRDVEQILVKSYNNL